jgi:hypothetical protein
MCRRDGISVPLVIHHKPRASVSRLVCKNLCKDEVASAMVNLTQGQVLGLGARVQGSRSRRASPVSHASAAYLGSREFPASWTGVLERSDMHCCGCVSSLPSLSS